MKKNVRNWKWKRIELIEMKRFICILSLYYIKLKIMIDPETILADSIWLIANLVVLRWYHRAYSSSVSSSELMIERGNFLCTPSFRSSRNRITTLASLSACIAPSWSTCISTSLEQNRMRWRWSCACRWGGRLLGILYWVSPVWCTCFPFLVYLILISWERRMRRRHYKGLFRNIQRAGFADSNFG